MNKGILVIISGASATGKDTIVAEIVKKYPDKAVLSVSMTTRKPRGEEKEGIDYYFVTPEQFEANINNNLMLEYAKYGNNYYGTPRKPVEQWLKEGKIVFLIIEVQGAKLVREKFAQARSIFVIPPSMKVLEQRLRKRGTESEDDIQTRLCIAKTEIERSNEYDYIVMNDFLQKAVEDVISICRFEKNTENHIESESTDVLTAQKHNKNTMKNTVSEVIENV